MWTPSSNNILKPDLFATHNLYLYILIFRSQMSILDEAGTDFQNRSKNEMIFCLHFMSHYFRFHCYNISFHLEIVSTIKL